MRDALIPKQFHFVFGLAPRPERFHLAFYLCLASCRAVNNPDRMFFHCHHEPFGPYWDRIRDQLTIVPVEPDPFVAAYEYPEKGVARYRYAHHADVVRLDALIDAGGIYADIDTIFVNPVPDALLEHPFVLGREADVQCQTTGVIKPSLCNAFIASAPGAAFARAWRRRLYDAFDGSWSNHSGFLANELSCALPADIHVEPPRTFYKHMFTPADLHTLFEGLDPDFSGVVSMHLWSHLWWNRRRRDFSRFHAGLLTEDYVRRGDTTYAIAARPFLPVPHRATVRLGRGTAADRAAGPQATVSIVIPTYNRSSLLAEAMHSALAQSCPVREVVIVDDGSAEPHRRKLDMLAAAEPRVRVHQLPSNRGRSHARNVGLERATGDFVLFLDDDDLIDARMVESALSVQAAGAPADVIVCGGRYINTQAQPRDDSELSPFLADDAASPPNWVRTWMGTSARHIEDLERRPLQSLLMFVPPINACLVRRQAIGETRFAEDLECGEDWVFWLDLALKGCQFRSDPHGRVFVRQHRGNEGRQPTEALLRFREHALGRVKNSGLEEEFVAAARLALLRVQHSGAGHGDLVRLFVKSPMLFLKYGQQFCAREIYRLWRRTVPSRASIRLS